MTGAESAVHTQQWTDRATLLYRAVGLGAPVYCRDDVAELAGLDRRRSVRWWRAMGFAEIPEDVAAFTELDVEMVRRLAAVAGAGIVTDEAIMRVARLLGASFSRIADAQLALVDELTAALGNGGTDDHAAVMAAVDESVLELMQDSIVYVWRRHLLAALGRRLGADDTALEQAVGFADLSGFTKLSQRVSADQLSELVDQFESVAFDAVSAHGGRAVKLIGDEVLFVADTLGAAIDIGLDLATQLRGIAGMPEIHCGIAYGPTVSVGGDVFGPTVNLAARLTTIARRGTIVIQRASASQLAGRDDLELVRVRRTFGLKGIGDMRVVAVRQVPQSSPQGEAEPPLPVPGG